MQPHLADSTPFIVAIVKRPSDWHRLQHALTYHIPLAQFAKYNHAQGIAWYMPRWHSTPYCVTHWALIEDIQICTRAIYMPHEANHPQAHAPYAIIRVGRLNMLMPPLHAQRWHRFGVYGTAWGALTRANDLAQLARHRSDYGDVAGHERTMKSTISTII